MSNREENEDELIPTGYGLTQYFSEEAERMRKIIENHQKKNKDKKKKKKKWVKQLEQRTKY